MTSFEWATRERDYRLERDETALPRENAAAAHPLLPKGATAVTSATTTNTAASGGSSTTEEAPFDPLSAALAEDEPVDDPLSLMAAQADEGAPMDPLSLAVAAASSASAETLGSKKVMGDEFEPWEARKAGILAKYTTSERLSIQSSFLGGGTQVVKNPVSTSDKVQQRLEQLDDDADVRELMDLSQSEYVMRINELNEELKSAWSKDARVRSLKLVIQSAKLLGDTSVLAFFPSKSVLVYDILDSFGELVFQRIRAKAATFTPGSSIPKPLPENFTPDQVPESAKVLARNWHLKIASIRELIPRLYVEASLMKIYSFLSSTEYEQALVRLTSMMRGIGDPLVALYARTYLCHVGVKVAPEIKTHLMGNFQDFLTTFQQIKTPAVMDELALQRIDMPKYLNLFVPGLDWILQCLAYKAPEKVLLRILDSCKGSDGGANNALLINSIMSAFPPEYIATRALEFITLIKDAAETGLPKHHLYRTLGVNLGMSPPPKEDQLKVLNEVWKEVSKLTDPADYMSCAEVWIAYPVNLFGNREINALLGDIIRHVQADRAYSKLLPQLQSVVGKCLACDLQVLFSMEYWMPILDLFQGDKIYHEVCKGVMEAFVKQQGTTNDAVIINGLMQIGTALHNSVTALTFDDEVRQISALIVGFLSRVSFGRDFEQTLNFLTNARAAFTNLDGVLQYLVQAVCRLAMRTHALVKTRGGHTRKTRAFVASCMAYCFITAPSITSVYERLKLYLLSARVALVNGALTQADALLEAAIALMPDMPSQLDLGQQLVDAEPLFSSLLCNFLGTLIMLPDHPDRPVLNVTKALLAAVAEYDWNDKDDGKFKVMLAALSLLAAYSQGRHIYGVEGVDANDALYGSSPKYIAMINDNIDFVLKQILDELKGVSGDRQANMALDAFDRIAVLADLTRDKTVELANNLWGLAKRAGASPTRQNRSLRLLDDLYVQDVGGVAALKASCS